MEVKVSSNQRFPLIVVLEAMVKSRRKGGGGRERTWQGETLDSGQQAAALEGRQCGLEVAGPAPHCYLIIFCSSDIATIVLGEEVETELCLGITDWTPAHSLLGDTAPGHA